MDSFPSLHFGGAYLAANFSFQQFWGSSTFPRRLCLMILRTSFLFPQPLSRSLLSSIPLDNWLMRKLLSFAEQLTLAPVVKYVLWPKLLLPPLSLHLLLLYLLLSPTCSFKKVMKSPDKDHWLLAAQKEFSSLISKGTLHLVPLIFPMRVIGCSWKFKLERDRSGAIIKYKARLVARGDMQHLDFASVFAPTLRYTTLRVLLALACHYDFEIEQMDVVSAFLHADVVSDIYMKQSKGYHTPFATGTRLVCKLDKALYGICEVPRARNALLSSWLISYGFSQSNVDPVIFTITFPTLLYVLAVYVDDCIIVGRNGPFIYNFKSAFSTRFDNKDLGLASWLLGCNIVRDRSARTLTLSQLQYASDILEQFGISTCSPAPTPMSSKPTTDPLLDFHLDVKLLPFASLLGKLL